MQEIDVLCLANSRKMAGRCVAGLRLDGGGWLRPISRPEFKGTLSIADCLLDDDSEAALLDVIRISVTKPAAEPHQPENWLMAPVRWQLIERLAVKAARPLLQAARVSGPSLLGSLTDRVAYSTFHERPAAASLALVEPQTIAWRIGSTIRGNRQTRAHFTLGGTSYDLSVTDPLFEQRLATLKPGAYTRPAAGIAPRDRILFTISLGEPFPPGGDCFKLIAAVIVLPGSEHATPRIQAGHPSARRSLTGRV